MGRIIVEEGADRGKTLDFDTAPSARLGRDIAAELPLRDLRASHSHARLERRADGVWIVDLQSRNGTFVNGTPVHEQRLQPGDRIRIGDSHLKWVAEEAAGGGAPARKSLADRLQAFYHGHEPKGPEPVADHGSRRVIAFEIEGTLITTDGLASEALEQTLRETCGVLRPFAGLPVAGRCETEIIRNAMRAAGMPSERIRLERPRILSRYVSYLGNALSRRSRGRLLPGVRPLLDRLNADPRWLVGLFTRNTQLSARLLLGHFGLLGAFKFGVYADDAENPDALPGLLLVRAREAAGTPLNLMETWLVGDSVRNLAVARSAGMRAVAVATGVESCEALAEQKPALLFRSLEDVNDVMRQLNAGAPPVPGAAPPAAVSNITQGLTRTGGIGN